MSNIVFQILSEYDQLRNNKRKVTLTAVLEEIKKEKLLYVLWGAYFLLLGALLFIIFSDLPNKGIVLIFIPSLMIIVLGAANVISEKYTIKNEKDNYDKYRNKQNELAKILKKKYNIKTLK